MCINNQRIYSNAKAILNSMFGEDAIFRDGQYEAIEATLTNKRTLVVQRTGWGKSLVYFTCTKLLRNQGKGVTFVISPLLVLMQNQIESARKMGLRCEALNSSSHDRKEEILDNLLNDKLDLVLVTPETLFKEDVQKVIAKINIGLFVIDEAHCISDWGHDFRLEYSKLNRIINHLPSNVPLLATTATANSRVIDDLKEQLGENVFVSSGPLSRDSLSIQVINLPNKAMRYAWILNHINEIPGSGIIYCLTQRDCDYLADFLTENGIKVLSYHSRLNEEDTIRAETALHNNEIKAIIATVKLGMGYDKDDIAFVIHFQTPSNIVSYYQQIGRAGRKLDRAYAILMHGEEDDDIHNYFIKTAFPTEDEIKQILAALEESALSKLQLLEKLNIRKNRIEKALTFLENDGCIFKDESKYYLTSKQYIYDKKHYDDISTIRIKEYHQLLELANTKKCYMQFTVNALDDLSAEPCGHCSNCLQKLLFNESIDESCLQNAQFYLNNLVFDIKPRKQWAITSCTRQTLIEHINKVGICLSKYGDVGFGKLVKQGKYTDKRFCDELVGKSAEVLRTLIREKEIKHITCVPSLRSDIVIDFTKRLADSLNIQFIEALGKKSARQQKEMENSSHQCANAIDSFFIFKDVDIPNKIILVDDMIDSKWTITVCGNLLGRYGCEEVYPFALADTSNNDN